LVKKIFLILFLFITIAFSSLAQICQGSLGDPIVNITFGAGTNPGSPLSAATVNYQYAANDCPNDGFYTVRNNSINCFGNTWHSINADHTGNANGYFMLVNASQQPSAFYIDTVRGLCGSTTYEFAAWVLNTINPAINTTSIQPNLTFSIEKTDGTILSTYNTNNIPPTATPLWKQYGFFITTPVNVSDIVLRIFNNAQGGNGNDLALDDITFKPCGPTITPSINGVPSVAATVCEGPAFSFNISITLSAGYNSPVYQWQQNINGVWTDIAGATTTNFNAIFLANASAGNYLYRLTVAEFTNMGIASCRVSSPVITIQINKKPTVTVASNSPVCTKNNIQLTATGGTIYSWAGPNNFAASTPMLTINNAQLINGGKYYVVVKNTEGCQNIDSTLVLINPSPTASLNILNPSICKNDSIQLVASGGVSYQWIPTTKLSSATIPNPYASPLTTTDYKVLVSNVLMCTDTALLTLQVLDKPTANAGPDRTILAGNAITLNASATGSNLTYTWIDAQYINDIHAINPIINPPADTKYILNVTSNNGCGFATDTMQVKVYSAVYIPNTFTPNNDKVNDTWIIPALDGYPNFDMMIFNRYGEVVYKNSNAYKPWDGKFKGKDLPVGTYTYYLNLKIGNDLGKMYGTVLLLR
jgi:gliding motility-associated-like protein